MAGRRETRRYTVMDVTPCRCRNDPHCLEAATTNRVVRLPTVKGTWNATCADVEASYLVDESAARATSSLRWSKVAGTQPAL